MGEIGLRVGPFEIVEEAEAPEPGRFFLARRVGETRRQPTEVLVKLPGEDGHPDRAGLAAEFERLRVLADGRVPGPVGYFEGVGALAISRVQGLPLARLVPEPEERRLAVGLATWLDVAVDIAETIHNAHNKGMVHGHLDPHHLWIAADGRLWVWGFGPGPTVDAAPPWLPPERAQQLAPTASTDQWSLAALLVGVLVGAPPWGGPEPRAQALLGTTESWLDPVARAWPGLARVLRKMLDPAPGHRYPTIQSARQELLAQLRLASGVSERRTIGSWVASVSGQPIPDDADADTSERALLDPVEAMDDEATMMVDPAQLQREIDALRASRSAEPSPVRDEGPEREAPDPGPAQSTWPGSHDEAAADQEHTVMFSDRAFHDDPIRPEDVEHDTDMNRRLDEGIIHEDDEDSMVRTMDRSAVPFRGEVHEPSGVGLPPLDLPIDDPTAERYQVPMYVDDDEESGPYHRPIDIAEIDTAPNESLHGVPSPLPLPPRPLSPPEKLASGLLVTLAALVLVWALVQAL